jgi:hypothetical protein
MKIEVYNYLMYIGILIAIIDIILLLVVAIKGLSPIIIYVMFPVLLALAVGLILGGSRMKNKANRPLV